MAREGNNIIGITKCNGESQPLVEYKLEKGAPSGNIYTISGGWKVIGLPAIK